MKKKLMALVLALAMCVCVVACGDDTEKNNKEDSSTQQTENEQNSAAADQTDVGTYEPTYGEVEIDFWHHMDAELFDELAQIYMDEHPNVKINVLSIGFWDMGTKMTPALAGGTAPDIYLYDLATAQQRLFDEQSVNLTKHLEARGVDMSQFLPAAVECCTLEGELAALPYLTDVRILYYNKDYFAEAGIEQPPATWDEVLEYSKKLTKFDADGNVERVGFHTGLGNFYPQTMLWTYGGDLMDGEEPVFNSQETIDMMQMALDLQDVAGGYDSFLMFSEGTQSSTMDAFVMGDVAMVVNTNEFATTIVNDNPDLNWGAVILPTSDGINNHATWSGGFDLEFTDHGDEDRLNAAIDFGVWLVSEEAQVKYGVKSANLMCNNAAAKAVADARDDLPEDYWAAVTESYGYARYVDYVFSYPEYYQAFYSANTYILNGTKTIEDALNDGVKIVEQEINNYHLMNN